MTYNSQIAVQPLSKYKEGTTVTVSSIAGGKGARKKLFDLGIIPGVQVKIVQGAPSFPYILQVGGSRIMIGWGMVQKIFVGENRR